MAKILENADKFGDDPGSGIYEKRDAPDYAPINNPVVTRPIRGARYEAFVDEGWAHKVAYGEISMRDCAKETKLTAQIISGYIAAFVEDERKEDSARFWEMEPGAAKEIRPDLELKMKNIPALVRAFVLFRTNNFSTYDGKPYITTEFHARWIEGIIRALITGGKITILSPPRHGKTDLLVHFIIWMLIRNPNLRVLWVGGNKDVAQLSVDQAKNELEDNEALMEKFLPPGHKFKPEMRQGKWRSSEFTVATRTLTLKAPSCIAVGRMGKLLSRDTDWIITDDLEDHDSTVQEGERKKTRGWFNQNLGTRKEAHTAWTNIGSRQHTDDLHGHLLVNPGWAHIVEKAHDASKCEAEMHGPDYSFIPDDHDENPDCEICKEHDKGDCVLFPEVRNMWFLMEQYRTMEPDYPGFFEMNYNNNPQDAGVKLFIKEHIEQCYNHDIRMGYLTDIPQDPKTETTYTHLVGGLDPSYSGYQTSFLWAFNIWTAKRFAMDIENRKGGGIPQARDTIRRWFELYELRHWVIETNLYKKGIIEDEKLVDYCSANNIRLEGWETYSNKWDPIIGVTAYAPKFRDQEIILPTGDPQSQAKINEYKKQLLGFNSDAKLMKNNPMDIVMSSWFPEVVFRRLLKDKANEMSVEYDQLYYPSEMYGDIYEGLLA